MLAARVPSAKAEGLRKYLQRKGLLSSKYRVLSSGEFIYFPLFSRNEERLEGEMGRFEAKIVDAKLTAQHSKRAQRTAQGYELYGSIAIIESEPKKADKIARNLLLSNRNIKTVLRKGGAVSGRYRTRRFFYVAGSKNYIVDYKENGCEFRFDIRKVFFSTKLGYERKRVSDSVKDGERVIVMFAGVGPYAIEIAKSHKTCKVVAIELNRTACDYMRANTRLNKTPNVAVEEGDVSCFARKYARFADRIIMPLPKEAGKFLPLALKMCRRTCKIHYYSFCKIGREKEEINMLKKFVEGKKKRFKLIAHRAVRPYSASEIELAVDFKVL